MEKKVIINGKEMCVLKRFECKKEDINKKHVFIVGSKGIPANYGGFETFVENLTEHQMNKCIKYHVACMSDNIDSYEYNGAACFNVSVPNIGPAKAVYYDLKALDYCIEYCRKNPSIEKPVFYVLACRIGPFVKYYKRKIEKLGGVLYVNPDGHEWKRAKWSMPVRKYWKLSEKLMVKNADLLVCDSKNIEKYIKEEYCKYAPRTVFIAYGANINKSVLKDNDIDFLEWLTEKKLGVNDYYLVVGRFVPENNYETMIREFMKSNTKKSFALITNVTDDFLNELKKNTHFDQDTRIKFVGTVYNQELLKKIRENAYAYFHGHEVGGTNPSLLEALGSTELNLLLNVGFNKEVAEDSAVYWSKEERNLAELINEVDLWTEEERLKYGAKAKKRIQEAYSWEYIVKLYERLFDKS